MLGNLSAVFSLFSLFPVLRKNKNINQSQRTTNGKANSCVSCVSYLCTKNVRFLLFHCKCSNLSQKNKKTTLKKLQSTNSDVMSTTEPKFRKTIFFTAGKNLQTKHKLITLLYTAMLLLGFGTAIINQTYMEDPIALLKSKNTLALLSLLGFYALIYWIAYFISWLFFIGYYQQKYPSINSQIEIIAISLAILFSMISSILGGILQQRIGTTYYTGGYMVGFVMLFTMLFIGFIIIGVRFKEHFEKA